MDLNNAQLAADKTAQIEAAVDSGIQKIKSVWQQMIDGLVDAWRYIYDNIIMPIFDGIRTAWLWVYDNILKPILEWQLRRTMA